MTFRAQLQTARLLLRPVAARDEAAILANMNNLDVSGWLASVPVPYTVADFNRFVGEIARPGETFAVEDAEGFAGIVGAGEELGYWFAPRAQGRGYATEAAKAILAAQFARCDSDVISGYFEGNARSARVLEKLGFAETGRYLRHCRPLNRFRPHVDLRLTAAVFAARLKPMA